MANFEEHEFQYDGGKTMFYLAAGPPDGPLLIFLHGWFGIAKLWRHQLQAFASLGFRVIAPDMQGFGRSSARKVTEDYCLEQVNIGMVELLRQTQRSRAVWIGHDLGCGAVWSFAAHYPELCVAVAGIAVPYGVFEMGFDELVKTVNRDIYPEDQYPYGQWGYQKFYMTDFEKATSWFDADIPAVVRALFSKASPDAINKPALTANVARDGGWFGGCDKPDPKWRDIPSNAINLDEETYHEVVAAMQKTGFWAADAWYANHERNHKYATEKSKNDRRLDMPVLFIDPVLDAICSPSVSPGLGEPMRRLCSDLTEVNVRAAHFVTEEKPEVVSAAICRWLIDRSADYWPTTSVNIGKEK